MKEVQLVKFQLLIIFQRLKMNKRIYNTCFEAMLQSGLWAKVGSVRLWR